MRISDWSSDVCSSDLICAVLVAEATNTGFEPLVRSEVPALRRSRLSWVKQNFMRAETLTAANALLVAAHNRIPLTRAWGGGEVASADGLRFTVPGRTLHAGPNPPPFGRQRGERRGVVKGTSVSGRVDHVGRRCLQKKT